MKLFPLFLAVSIFTILAVAEARHVPGWSITPPPPRRISADGEPLVFQRPFSSYSGSGEQAKVDGAMSGLLQIAQWSTGESFLLFTNSLGIKYIVTENSVNSSLRAAVGQRIRVTESTVVYGNHLTILAFDEPRRAVKPSPPAATTPSPTKPMPAAPSSAYEDL